MEAAPVNYALYRFLACDYHAQPKLDSIRCVSCAKQRLRMISEKLYNALKEV